MLFRPSGAAHGLRPNGPVSLNQNSPAYKSLVASVYAGSPYVIEPFTGLQMIGATNLLPSPYGGFGMGFNTAGAGLSSGTAPSSLRIQLPLTLDCWVVTQGAPTANAGLFGLIYNTAGGSPFAAYQISYDGSSNICFNTNVSGVFTQKGTSSALTVGQLSHVLVTVDAAGASAIYKNGVLLSTSTGLGTINYSVTSFLSIGNYTGVSRNSNISGLAGRIWTRNMSAAEVWRLWDPATRWDLYQVPSTRVFFDIGSGGPTPVGASSFILFRPPWTR